MAQTITRNVELRIIGPPRATIRIVPRDRGDMPPSPVFVGTIDESGEVLVPLEKGYYVVLSDGYQTAPADFLMNEGVPITVTLTR
jgi:hypothetical protein